MSEQHLVGLKIVLTGDFKSHTRKEAVKVLEDLGADVTGAVSGKTKVIIAGTSPGSKLQKGKAKGLPILDEAQMILLIGGKTLEEVLTESTEEVKPRTSMPQTLAFPKEGKFELFFSGTNQLQISGFFKSGLRHGSWKEFWSNGQIKQDYEWREGLKDGPELDWEVDGTQVCEGVNVAGIRSGTWTWWHANGSYSHAFHYDNEGKRHGDYKWDLADGSKRARGGYWHGTRDGKWEWWQEKAHKNVVRDYVRGQQLGGSKAWFHNGQLAYDMPDTGIRTSFFEDGSPKSKGEFLKGSKLGLHSTWDQAGKRVDITYIQGVPEKALTEKKLASLMKKLSKARDGYAKTSALEKVVEWSEKSAMVLYLWREGHYDLPRDPELWEVLSESERLISGEEIARFLATAAKTEYTSHIPNWNRTLDELVMRVYLRDPDPIDKVWQDLPEHCKVGVALVRARFGKNVDDILKGKLKAVVKTHAENYGLESNILWPNANGDLETQQLFEDDKKPTALFDTFLSFFGTQKEWVSELKTLTQKSISERRLSFHTFRPVIKTANVEELSKYCSAIALNSLTHDMLHKMLLEIRNDSGADITQIAMGMTETGLAHWPVVCAAITRLSQEGNPIPQELIDSLQLTTESPTYTSSWKTQSRGCRVDLLPVSQKLSFHFLSSFFPLNPGFAVPRCQILRDALSKLTEEQRISIFERHLSDDRDYVKTLVIPYLYLVDSPELWARAFEVASGADKPVRDTFAWGFGELGLRFLPNLIKYLAGEKRKTFKAPWQESILVALLRASVDGDGFDETLDEHIKFGLADTFLLEHLLYRLPPDRSERILLNSTDPKYASSVFKLIALRPNETSLKYAFELLLSSDGTLTYTDQENIKMGFASLPNGEDWLRWLIENGASNDVFRQAIDYKTFDAIVADLKDGGKELAKPLDKIDKLVAACAEKKGSKERIYALRRLEDSDAKTDLNILGGPAPGVGLDRWPFFQDDKDEPMEHLYTIDLATIPELQARYKDSRTLSLFCYQPENNEAYTADSGWTEILFSSQKEIDAGSEVPEDQNMDIEARFEVVSIDVNMEDKEIRNQVYSLNARVLGNEIWLQSEEYWGDFVMQFDEGFCGMNLGDSGVMYVYSDGAFWQCY